jgi:hypothetical protein
MFQFKAMRTPTDKLEVGSTEWKEGMSLRLQHAFERTEEQGVERLIDVLHNLLPHKPWDEIPINHPCRRADTYFQGVTGKPWRIIVALVEPYDRPLALEIESYCNPGSGGDRRSDDFKHDNVMFETPATQGNSLSYTLNRLRRKSPELFNAVLAGDMSANAAAIQAGFRKQATPLENLERWWRKASPEEQEQFLRSITHDRI